MDRDWFDLNAYEQALRTKRFGRRIFTSGETGSTNDWMRDLWREGKAGHGAAAAARTQSGGRGRRGREWESPPGGLWFSVLLTEGLTAEMARTAVPLGGLASLDALRSFGLADEGLRLGWPNDVVLNGRKLGGCLVEGAFEAGRPIFLIVGVGLNLNVAGNQFTPEVARRATSLFDETGAKTPLEGFLGAWLNSFEAWSAELGVREAEDRLTRRWRDELRLTGSFVRFEKQGSCVEGIVKSADLDGTLHIERREDGAAVAIPADEGFLLIGKYRKEI